MDELILSWKDMVRVYGGGLTPHQRLLEKATQATHGLLACSALQAGQQAMQSIESEHAEERLMQSALWQDQITEAIDAWTPGQRPILTLLAINRAPCSSCAHLLAGKLHALKGRVRRGINPHRFVLASRGYYQGRNFMSGKPSPNHQASKLKQYSREVTTDRGMQALKDAGWLLRVTEFGNGPTKRGDELLEFLARM
ncbi:MAG: hypothetical protein Q7V20_21640 [Aquabacterium sp.]|uniref:hypothetical protein n=1 Tax=Aquabacterium sp. TaxID=1872578 RepID=UPI00271693AD|nr:hypothetical protein [Aquabacterium sp.]MDO9006055.1 hypothetical protein [Aquabacterium sp.]